jgi:hypothetical protein
MHPFAFLVICAAGWMNRNQQDVIEYLQKENRVLKEQLGKKPRLHDGQRRRVATKGQRLRREALDRSSNSVTPEHFARYSPNPVVDGCDARHWPGPLRNRPAKAPSHQGCSAIFPEPKRLS